MWTKNEGKKMMNVHCGFENSYSGRPQIQFINLSLIYFLGVKIENLKWAVTRSYKFTVWSRLLWEAQVVIYGGWGGTPPKSPLQDWGTQALEFGWQTAHSLDAYWELHLAKGSWFTLGFFSFQGKATSNTW